MRPTERIPVVLDAIRTEWERNPDLRLLQLLVVVLHGKTEADLFFVEDEVLLDAIRRPSYRPPTTRRLATKDPSIDILQEWRDGRWVDVGKVTP